MLPRKPTYCDLNIPIGPKCREVSEAAIEHGYGVLAINTPVVARNCLLQSQGNKVGKKRKLEERTGGALSAAAASQASGGLPEPKIPDWIASLTSAHQDLRILQRLTVIFSDVTDLQGVLNQPNAKLFDVIAVVPTNHEALQACIISTTLIFDIISFDFEGPHWINKIRLNRQKGKVAAEKDVYFEVPYAPSFHGDEPCENMIYMANRLTEDICTRRVKNILLSSGASKSSELRSPKDVLGVGLLLGLDETTTRLCIREHAQRIVAKSDARKYGKSWVAFIPSSTEETQNFENLSNSSKSQSTNEEITVVSSPDSPLSNRSMKRKRKFAKV